MLRDIPCPHAICAYYYLNQDPDQHVEHWYKKKTFLKAYNYFIRPIPNMRMWPETTNPSIEPPKLRKMQVNLARREERVRMSKKKWVQVGIRRGLRRTKTNARGTPIVTEKDNSSNQLPSLSGSSASFVAATRGNKRPITGFGFYFDHTTGAQVFNGKHAVNTSQLQQMKANKKNKGSCGTSKK
ncbi:hypothetical protein H5410_040039 [Solanum commersonii]|uniref:SWIM-type domain-containing protein n=1 Tax=Solanum commersonii TaxID=4109 RepID=A0A9J5XNX5_SOLCO|nr:hypothetical protein H5410_040039 [Solanum commersonii]